MLAEMGNEVYFVEPFRALLPGRGGRLSDLVAGPRIEKAGKVNVVSFSILPFYYRVAQFLKPTYRNALSLQFMRFSKLVSGGYKILTFDGRSLPFIMMLPPALKTVYYCVDPVGPGGEKRYSEVDLLNYVDTVFGISKPCVKSMKALSGRSDILCIPHGIDFYGRFQDRLGSVSVENTPSALLNSNLPNLGKINVGYTGSIHDIYVDFDLIVRAASEHPDWSFYFIGSFSRNALAPAASRKVKFLKDLENVHFLGSKPYWELSKYIDLFDVCLIPYRLDVENGWERRSPVKVLHYLSKGKPVVASSLPNLQEYEELCYLYESASDFLNKLNLAALEKTDDPLRERRVSLAKDRDVSIIYDRIISFL